MKCMQNQDDEGFEKGVQRFYSSGKTVAKDQIDTLESQSLQAGVHLFKAAWKRMTQAPTKECIKNWLLNWARRDSSSHRGHDGVSMEILTTDATVAVAAPRTVEDTSLIKEALERAEADIVALKMKLEEAESTMCAREDANQAGHVALEEVIFLKKTAETLSYEQEKNTNLEKENALLKKRMDGMASTQQSELTKVKNEVVNAKNEIMDLNGALNMKQKVFLILTRTC